MRKTKLKVALKRKRIYELEHESIECLESDSVDIKNGNNVRTTTKNVNAQTIHIHHQYQFLKIVDCFIRLDLWVKQSQ